MGLLDYYRQFSGLSDEEVSRELRRRSQDERMRMLARVEPLDLSATTWPELPHPDVVAAVTFAARRDLNENPDPTAEALRREIGHRSGLEAERIVVGAGAAQLIAAAIAALAGPGEEVVTPWPSYPLYPIAARQAGARAVPVEGGFSAERLLAAVGADTRVLVLCNPNDPTGERLAGAELDALLGALPERVCLVLDEALADFAESEPTAATLNLLDDHPRLLIVRTLSKAYGLAGLRCGWAMGGPGSGELLARLAPPLGLPSPVQAGALDAVRKLDGQVALRRAVVARERARVAEALHELPYDAPASEANVLWLRLAGVGGGELAARLRAAGVLVAPGAAVGDEQRVRVTVPVLPGATDRLLEALARAARRAPRAA